MKPSEVTLKSVKWIVFMQTIAILIHSGSLSGLTQTPAGEIGVMQLFLVAVLVALVYRG